MPTVCGPSGPPRAPGCWPSHSRLRPGDALKMVAMLDVPAVRAAVDGIVTAVRLATEREAERLRAQLADIESRLAELGGTG